MPDPIDPQPSSNDPLAHAVAALRQAPTPPGPDDAAAARILGSLQRRSTHPTFLERIQAMSKVARAAAALFLIASAASVGFLVVQSLTPRSAFADALDQLKTAQTYTATMSVEQDGKAIPPCKVFFKQPDHFRVELSPTLTNVFDGHHLLILDATENTYFLETRQHPLPLENPVDKLQLLTTKPDKDLGEKTVDHRTLHGYQVNQGQEQTTLWLHDATKAPVSMERTVTLPAHSFTVRVTDIQLNQPLDDSLFSMTPPSTMKPRTNIPANANFPEAPLVRLIVLHANNHKGLFPDDLGDFSSDTSASTNPAERTETLQIIDAGNKFLTGLSTDASHADLHYRGKGITLNTPKTPILWYRPKDQSTYFILNADLTIATSTTPPNP